MNQTIFLFLYSFAHRSVGLDALFAFIAEDFVWVILITTFFYLLKNKDRKLAIRDIVIVFGAAAAGAVASTALKNIFHTLRPFVQLPSIQPLISESGFAFPSGHTTDLMAICAALWRDHKKASIITGVSVLAVGLSRVIVGVHWPIDILGGILLGSAVGFGAYYVALRVLPNTKKSLY